MARIAFVQNLAVEYLAVMYLSASLKQSGHDADVFILRRSEKNLARQILDFRPDLVAFSCTTGMHHWAVNFAAYLKRLRPVLTIFGGPHPTFCPDLINEPAVDIRCRGEGEETIVEIADKLDAKEPVSDTLNCHVKTNGKILKI